jgi:MFS family permease
MLIIYLIPPFLATANALTMSFGTALITRVTPDNIRGEVMGINSSANALAMAIPGLLGGYAAQYGARLPILIGGITIILGGIIFNYLFDPQKIKIYK